MLTSKLHEKHALGYFQPSPQKQYYLLWQELKIEYLC